MNEFAATQFSAVGSQGVGGGRSKRAGRGGMTFAGSSSTKLDLEKFGPIEKESSKMAVEMSNGLMIEFLKKFMFAY